MENEHTVRPVPTPLEQALEETGSAAREQLSAAWQLHIERIEEQLHSGWRDHVGQVFDERLAELSTRLAEEFDRSVAERAAALAGERARAERRAAFEQLDLSVRRLSQAQASGEWAAALLDAASSYCRRCLLFSVALRSVIAEGSRGFDEVAAADYSGREIRLQSAPAFATAIETRDVVIAQRSSGEISEDLAAWVGEADEERAHIYPILARGRCAALLYAEPIENESSHSALDLLVVAAGLSLGARPSGAAATGLVAIAAPGATATSAPPDWYGLPPAERELHQRAQRFARVQVAEMRLYQSAAVRFGRAHQNLYEALKTPIDAAREAFRRQFLADCPSMSDYLHQELVRTLANGDAAAFGASYPGPLV